LPLGNGTWFLFSNKLRDKIKVLYWALPYKRLEKSQKNTDFSKVAFQADKTPINVLKEDKQRYMWLYGSEADFDDSSRHHRLVAGLN